MRKLIMAGVGALLLAGCTTPEQKAASMQAEMNEMMAVYGPACTRLGYAANSDQWRSCVLQLSTREEIQRSGYPSYSAMYGRGHWGFGGRWNP